MFGDTTSKTLGLGSLDDHAEALARMLDTTSGTSTTNGGGAVAAANDGATGAAIHPALVLLNHRFLQEVQRHERAMAAVKIAQEEVPDTDGAPSDTPAGSPPDVQQSEAARDGNFFFMAAVQLLEARAQSRRGVVLPDTNMSALAVPATPGDGTDADDDSTLPFGSPAPLSAARSRDLAAADVILSGWLMKHSDFHWKSKYVRGAGSHPKLRCPGAHVSHRVSCAGMSLFGVASWRIPCPPRTPHAASNVFDSTPTASSAPSTPGHGTTASSCPTCSSEAANGRGGRSPKQVRSSGGGMQDVSRLPFPAVSPPPGILSPERQRWIDALLLASKSSSARADEGLWAGCSRVREVVSSVTTRDAYV